MRDAIESEVNDIVSEIGWNISIRCGDDAQPGAGRAQALVNRLVKNCHLFVGLVWKRWGSGTGTSDSGFYEEDILARKLNRGLGGPGLPEIMLFFKRVPSAEKKTPGKQLARVLEFRHQIETGHWPLFKEFTTSREWERALRTCLLRHVLWLERNYSTAQSESDASRSRLNQPGTRRFDARTS